MWFVVRNDNRGRNAFGVAGRSFSGPRVGGGNVASHSFCHRGPKTFRPKHQNHQHRYFLRGGKGSVLRGGSRRFGSSASFSGFVPNSDLHRFVPYPDVTATDEDIMIVDDGEPLLHPRVHHYPSPPSLPSHQFHYQHHPQFLQPHANVVDPHSLDDRVGWYALDGNIYFGSDPTDATCDDISDGDSHDGNAHQGDVVVIDLNGNSQHCSNNKTGSTNKTDGSVCGDNKKKKDQQNNQNQNRQRQVGIKVSSNCPDQSDDTTTSRTSHGGSTTGSPSSTPSIAFLAVKGPNGVVAVPIRTKTEKDTKDVASTMDNKKGTETSASCGNNVQDDSEKTEEGNSNEKKTDDNATTSKFSEAKMQPDGADNTKVSKKSTTVAASEASPARSASPSKTTTKKMFPVRTPAHFEENASYATISFDVTGFTMDQLEVRIDGDENNKNSNNNTLLLKVSGKRLNNIGDEFVIDRKFVLIRDQVATCDVDELHVEANLSEQDGILSIRVPKKQQMTK